MDEFNRQKARNAPSRNTEESNSLDNVIETSKLQLVIIRDKGKNPFITFGLPSKSGGISNITDPFADTY